MFVLFCFGIFIFHFFLLRASKICYYLKGIIYQVFLVLLRESSGKERGRRGEGRGGGETRWRFLAGENTKNGGEERGGEGGGEAYLLGAALAVATPGFVEKEKYHDGNRLLVKKYTSILVYYECFFFFVSCE